MDDTQATVDAISFKPKKLKENFIVDILQTVIIALTISVIIYLVIAIPNQVDGQSMEPNFHDKELLLTNKIVQWFGQSPLAFSLHMQYEYERGDVPKAREWFTKAVEWMDQHEETNLGDWVEGELLRREAEELSKMRKQAPDETRRENERAG